MTDLVVSGHVFIGVGVEFDAILFLLSPRLLLLFTKVHVFDEMGDTAADDARLVCGTGFYGAKDASHGCGRFFHEEKA